MSQPEYIAELGLKIDWSENKFLSNADPIFFDATKPKNGLNANASNYSGVNGYELYIVCDAKVSNGAVDTEYRLITDVCKANDFDVPSVTPRDFTATIILKDLDDNIITGFIPNNDTVQFICEYEYVGLGSINDYLNAYGIHRIEVGTNQNYNIYELSSVKTNLGGNNPLIALTGETGLKVEYVGNKIITTCLIDGSKLVNGVTYNLSTRLGLPQQFYNAPQALFDNQVLNANTGEYSFDLTMISGAGGFNEIDQVIINVYNDSTNALIETLTGTYNDSIAAFTSTVATSVKDYMVGVIDDAETLTFNKYLWALAVNLLNLDAIPLRFELIVTESISGLSSNPASMSFATELLEAQYSGDLRYLNTNPNYLYSPISQSTSTPIVQIDKAFRFSEGIINASISRIRSAITADESTFGAPYDKIRFIESDPLSPFGVFLEADTLDGITWNVTTLLNNLGVSGRVPNVVKQDDIRVHNGEPIYWVGTDDIGGVNNNYLYMLYYDGAAWQKIDFSARLVAPVIGTAATTVSVGAITNGKIYGFANANNPALDKRLFRLVQSVGSTSTFSDYSNPVNWSNASVMAGQATSGTTDGNGTSAQFKDTYDLVVINSDVNNALEIWVTDGSNHVIRKAEYNAGLDNYDITTIIGASGVSGDLNGIGAAARLNDVRGIAFDGTTVFIGLNGSKKIKQIDPATLTLDDFSGDGTNNFRLASIY